MIEERQFLKIIDSTPLVSIDLLVEDQQQRILLGKRVNRPAQNFWFVPGGIIKKNETIACAIKRISSAELGISISIFDAQLSGTFDHIYDDNFLGEDGINTHYVVLAYKVQIQSHQEIESDNQHSEMKWWSIQELLDASEVHQNTKAYFPDS